MNKKFLNISTIILTVVLAGLQMLPSIWDNIVCNWIRERSFWIALIAGGIVVLLHVIDCVFVKDRNKKKWLTTFLKHIIDEHLGSDTYQTRISILRKQKGYIVFFKTIWYYIVLNFFNNFKNGSWKESMNRVAIHLFSDYLVVYVRYSYPKAKRSCTYFRASDLSNKQKFNGVADKCFQEGLELSVNTPNITDITLPSDMRDLSEKHKKRVKVYMRACFFDEQYYDSLRGMQKIANNLYAVPIALNDQSIWGVVIIDSIRDDSHNFKEELSEYMASYMKIINFSLSALK